MSARDMTSVIRELFSAPCKAAIEAENDYRRIWAQWLQTQKALIGKRTDVDYAKLLNAAPVLTFDGQIQMGITMRIAEVQDVDVNLEGGLKLGPIYASGGLGLSQQQTQESIFQASANYTISNQKSDLRGFLEKHSLQLATADDVDKVMEVLVKDTRDQSRNLPTNTPD